MFSFFSWRTCAAALLAAASMHGSWAAEPLGLDEALVLAEARSQQLVASRAAVSASREMAIAAGQLPDPVLKLGVENLPINGRDRLSPTRDFMTMRRVGISQEIVGAHKRQLRSQRREQDADRIQAESDLNLASLRRDAATAWIERHYTHLPLELMQRQRDETRLQASTAEAGYGAGCTSQADVFAARSALVMLEDRVSDVQRQQQNASLVLARWIGAAAAARLPGGNVSWQTSHLEGKGFEVHFRSHPDLVALRARIDAAQTEVQLAEANKRPDWSIELMHSERGRAYSNMVSVGASVPLQLDRKNRQDRDIAAKLALLNEAQARYEDRQSSHEAEVRVLLNDRVVSKARVARYRTESIPLAGQRAEAALTAYRTGKSGLASTLSVRRDQLDVLAQALTAEMEAARAWARINFLIPEQHQDTATPAAGRVQ